MRGSDTHYGWKYIPARWSPNCWDRSEKMVVARGGPNGHYGPRGQEPEPEHGDDDVRSETENNILFYGVL